MKLLDRARSDKFFWHTDSSDVVEEVIKLLNHWRTNISFFLYTDSSRIRGSWTSPWCSWVTQKLINLSYAWFFFGSSLRSHKALKSLKKNWQISFPCFCNLLVFSFLSIGSLTRSQVTGVKPTWGSHKVKLRNWDLVARSRLPTLKRGRGSSWEPRD